MPQPLFINFFFLGIKFSFVSVISWEVGGMRFKGETTLSIIKTFFPVTVLLRTGSLSFRIYLQLLKHTLYWGEGGESLADFILDPVRMLSFEDDVLVSVINFVKS